MAGDLPRKGICAVCIGEKTAQAARDRGMDTITAENATVEELIACISNNRRQGGGAGVKNNNSTVY